MSITEIINSSLSSPLVPSEDRLSTCCSISSLRSRFWPVEFRRFLDVLSGEDKEQLEVLEEFCIISAQFVFVTFRIEQWEGSLFSSVHRPSFLSSSEETKLDSQVWPRSETES
jgi:hypothetical protein